MTRAADLADLGSAYGGYNGFGFRNALINGGMQVAQRGSSFNSIITGSGTIATMDRWGLYTTGASLAAAKGSGDGVQHIASLDISGAAGNTACTVFQRIESQHATQFMNRPATFSAKIYVAAPRSLGRYVAYPAAGIDNYSSGVSPSASGTFGTLAAGWNTVTFTVENMGMNVYKGIELCLFCDGALGAGESLKITGCQLELGREATPFEFRPMAVELAMCQRYYQLSGMIYGQSLSTTSASLNFPLVTAMRAVPTAAIVNGSNALVQMGGVNTNVTSITNVYSGGTQSMGLNVSGTYSSAGLQYGAATTGSVGFSAELF